MRLASTVTCHPRSRRRRSPEPRARGRPASRCGSDRRPSLAAALTARPRRPVASTCSVDSTTLLRSALRDRTRTRPRLPHRLVLADAAEATGRRLRASLGARDDLAAAGAAALAVTGVEQGECRRPSWRERADRAGLALLLFHVPLDASTAFTTEVLGAMLEHQTAILDRLEEAAPRPRADRPRGRLARRPVRAARRLLRRRRHGDDDRRPGAGQRRRARRARARAGARLLRPHRPAPHRDRAGGHPRPSTAPTAHRAAVRDRRRTPRPRPARRLLQPPARSRPTTCACSSGRPPSPRWPSPRSRPSRRSRASTAPSSCATPSPGAPAAPPRPSPTPARSAGTSTGRWSSSSPRPTRTTTADDPVDADEVRSLQQRFARAWTHAVPVRDPQRPVDGLQPGGRRAARRHRPTADTEPDHAHRRRRRPRRPRRRRRWAPDLLDRRLAADHVGGRACPRPTTRPSTAVQRRPADARRRRPDALRRPRDLPPARADPRRRRPAPLRRASRSASWPPTTPPRTPTCARP